MKKRLCTLFLALLMIFSLVSCNESEDFGEDFGELYTEDGVLQNTLIECVITEHRARNVSYEIHNSTPYLIYTDSNETLLQIKQNGEWLKAPYDENHFLFVDRDKLVGWGGTYKEVYCGGVSIGYYDPLLPGEYRVVVRLEAKKSKRAQIEEMYAVAYFSVGDEVYGTFEQKDGVLQNTSVTLNILNEKLTAPVVDPWWQVQNESYFDIELQEYAQDENYEYLLEVLQDGTWQKAPTFGEVIREEGTERADFWKREQIENGIPSLMDKRYIALEAGQYRIRVKYVITDPEVDVAIPEGQLEAVGYFTVTAP